MYTKENKILYVYAYINKYFYQHGVLFFGLINLQKKYCGLQYCLSFSFKLKISLDLSSLLFHYYHRFF